jgi:hypothetical protein
VPLTDAELVHLRQWLQTRRRHRDDDDDEVEAAATASNRLPHQKPGVKGAAQLQKQQQPTSSTSFRRDEDGDEGEEEAGETAADAILALMKRLQRQQQRHPEHTTLEKRGASAGESALLQTKDAATKHLWRRRGPDPQHLQQQIPPGGRLVRRSSGELCFIPSTQVPSCSTSTFSTTMNTSTSRSNTIPTKSQRRRQQLHQQQPLLLLPLMELLDGGIEGRTLLNDLLLLGGGGGREAAEEETLPPFVEEADHIDGPLFIFSSFYKIIFNANKKNIFSKKFKI